MNNRGTIFFRVIMVALLVLLLVLEGTASNGQAAVENRPMAAAPTIATQVFDVNCSSLASVTPTYAKLVDLGVFQVNSQESEVELTFNGRIFVGNFSAGTGAVFELRVDDVASTVGRARANLRTSEAGGGGQPVSISGIFRALPVGAHTASMWVRTSLSGAATQAMVDPGCWSTDVLIVREFLPFGMSYLPYITR